MQGYHTGLPHLLFPSKQHIKHDKRVKQCLKLKTPAGRRANIMRKNARRLGGTTPCAKTPTSWASALHAQVARLPVTSNGESIHGLLSSNSGHDGGVLSANIPKYSNDKNIYVNWKAIVDKDGNKVPVPMSTTSNY